MAARAEFSPLGTVSIAVIIEPGIEAELRRRKVKPCLAESAVAPRPGRGAPRLELQPISRCAVALPKAGGRIY